MSRSIARSALVVVTLLALAACTSATAPTTHDCGGGVTGGTGTCH